MVDFKDVKKGDRIRVTYEGVAEYTSNDIVYAGSNEFAATPELVSVEIIKRPLPIEFGWYEAEALPLAEGFKPYRLDNRGWRDAKGDQIALGDIENIAPMHKLGRVVE